MLPSLHSWAPAQDQGPGGVRRMLPSQCGAQGRVFSGGSGLVFQLADVGSLTQPLPESMMQPG